MGDIANMDRRIWRIALPMTLSALTIPLVGMVDSAVMGRFDEPYYMGAVALASMIFSFMLWGLGSLRMTTTGMTAQAYGAGNHTAILLVLYRSLCIAVICALCVLLLQWPLLQLALYLTEASQQVELLAAEYYSIRIWAIPASLLCSVAVGWLIGTQHIRSTIIILVFVNLLNILLDIVLVFVFDMGIAGVALATVCAEYGGLVLSLLLLWRASLRFKAILSWTQIWQLKAMQQLFNVNQQMFIRTLLLILAFAFFTNQSAAAGDVVLAANSVLLHYVLLMAYGSDGIAFAAEVVGGEAIGANNRQRFFNCFRRTALWSGLVALIFTLVYACLNKTLIDLLTLIPEVREYAADYVIWMLILPLISVWGFWLDGIFVGATRAKAMRNAVTLAFVFYIVCYYCFVRDNGGLWLSFCLFFIVRSIVLLWIIWRDEKAQGFVRLSNRLN